MLSIAGVDLKENATLTASYKFAKAIDYDFTNGMEVVGCSYVVSTDIERLSVDNLQVGDAVRVFTINGMGLVDDIATNSKFSVTLPNGEYIILINDKSLKVAK